MIAFLGLVVLAGQVWQAPAGHAQIPIWPGKAPDLVPTPPENGRGVTNVSRPTMTLFPAKGRNTGAAMVVFPGGGYQGLAMGLEGTEVCEWLARHGITGVLLKYRVPNSGPHWDAKVGHEVTPRVLTAVEDAQRTLGLVRLHARSWGIDPRKVGVIGFSAGGHLVAACSNALVRLYKVVDAADGLDCRPDFAVAMYPGHLWREEWGLSLNPAIKVSGKTPPTFIVQAEDDPVDDVRNSIVYDLALKKAGASVEMHLFAHGGHAFGLRAVGKPIGRWPELMMRWLRGIGVIS